MKFHKFCPYAANSIIHKWIIHLTDNTLRHDCQKRMCRNYWMYRVCHAESSVGIIPKRWTFYRQLRTLSNTIALASLHFVCNSCKNVSNHLGYSPQKHNSVSKVVEISGVNFIILLLHTIVMILMANDYGEYHNIATSIRY